MHLIKCLYYIYICF